MTSLILWYQLDESFILALRHPAVPLLQPDTVMLSDCCNCSACSSYSSAIQLAPTSWLCHIALMGCLGMDPHHSPTPTHHQPPPAQRLNRTAQFDMLMWNVFTENTDLLIIITLCCLELGSLCPHSSENHLYKVSFGHGVADPSFFILFI